jgi:hypothetical protein
MARNKRISNIGIGGDVAGNFIQGDGNTVISNELDSEAIHQGLQDVSEAIYETSRRERWKQFREKAGREESREVLETVFISTISGIATGVFWKVVFPWNAETVSFFVILTLLLSFVLNLTHFGLRHTITLVMTLGLVYSFLIRFAVILNDWMDLNQFVGTAILSTLGAMIGLLLGVVLLFWKPLGD